MLIGRLDHPVAYDIAKAMISGFNRHHQFFRAESARAKHRFETQDWRTQQSAQKERIAFYDLRVDECRSRLSKEFNAQMLELNIWQQVKLHYIGMLVDHHQPELAETFFNSVVTKLIERSYFKNEFIFLRPAVSTEYIENSEDQTKSTYRAWYPKEENLKDILKDLILSYELRCEFEDLERDVQAVCNAMQGKLGNIDTQVNFQLQALSSLFFRNKGAYLVGKLINGFQEFGFALPILFTGQNQLMIDAALFGEDDLLILFSFSRAYFMVDMEIPSAYVRFLSGMMPHKPQGELYNALGLAKQGKNLFYRDFLSHLQHSTDGFRISPGIKGMVMLVFDLPSFPYVFKVIKDFYPPPKETSREQIKAKYLLVKQHDRVGRMADTLDYSNVAFPKDRFDPELIAEIQHHAPSQIEILDLDGDGEEEVVIKHVYIERRMTPLNIYLQTQLINKTPTALKNFENAIQEYGNASKDMVAANIFPGDMLWKNFGVTRHGRVVFYDYDEIEYITDCNFRRVPQARNEEEELSGEIWYSVGPRDVFPETFAPFLLGHGAMREVFMRHHADLLDVQFWQSNKEKIMTGYVHDVYPYDVKKRLINQRLEQGVSHV